MTAAMSSLLFPTPRLREPLSGDPVAPTTAVQSATDSSLPPQGFVLSIDTGSLRLSHADAAGERYGRQLVAQLASQHPDGIPPQRIEDSPDFPIRGYMLDISRTRVPTRGTLERLVEILNLCRINHLELYTEHTFAYREHEPVWRDASPMTADDLRWLDRLCLANGIELSANQNCFGHMERWLSRPAYRSRAECPDGWTSMLAGNMPPAVLAPTQANADFAVALVREMLASLTSRRVNIGCDETFELGRGASHADVAGRGRGRVYLDHLQRLIAPLRDDGCEVLFWGDILRNHPELVGELPRDNALALVWHYEMPIDPDSLPPALLQVGAEFGITADVLRGFRGQIGAFADSGFPHWVCPGTSSWNSFVGRLGNARANLLDAAAVGRESGARGYLITDWGDSGHLQPPSVSWPPLLYGAGLSWCAESNRDLDIAATLDRFVFADDSGRLGRSLVQVGDAYSRTGQLGFNASPLFTAVVRRGLLGALGMPQANALGSLIEDLEHCSAAIASSQPRCRDGAIVRRELRQAIALARHGALRLLHEAGGSAPADTEMRRDLDDRIAEQRVCWLMRSRAGGLEESLGRLRPD